MKQLLLLFSILGLLISCAEQSPTLKVLQGNAFGTTYSIQYYSDYNFDVEKGVDSVIYAINKSVSTYLPESDISKINRGDTSIKVDDIFKEVFQISEKVYNSSDGYFDPTIGVLRNAYGFGDTKPLVKLSPSVIDSLMEFVGFQKVKLAQDGTIQKKHSNIYFDFNAVAKGYGIDQIGAYLSAQGVSHFLIELGGEILAKGENQTKNKAWVVGVESPSSKLDGRTTNVTIKLENKGMAGSGNYRKFRVDSFSGKKYVHTINPLTGSAEQSDVTSATIIATTCAEADAYATACMALGLEKSVNLLRKTPNIEAYLTYLDSSQNEQVFISEGFKKVIIK